MKNLTGTTNVWVNALVLTVLLVIVVSAVLILSQLGNAQSFTFSTI